MAAADDGEYRHRTRPFISGLRAIFLTASHLNGVPRVDLRPFTVLSLCSGAGGLELGLRLAEPAARVVCHVEIEAFACEVLATRMEEELLDQAPVWTDLGTFDGRPWRGVVDCLSAGYPCQPFSIAGRRKGTGDPRQHSTGGNPGAVHLKTLRRLCAAQNRSDI